MRKIRIQLILLLSRILGVPVDVHQAFFVKGISLKRS